VNLDHLLPPAVAKRVAALPQLRAFLERLAPALEKEDEAAFWECRRDFEVLVRGDFLRALLRHELERAAQDPLYLPSFPGEGCLDIARCSLFEVTLMFLSEVAELAGGRELAPPARIRDAVEHRMIGVVGPGTIIMECFRQPSPYPHDVIDRSRRLVEQETVELGPGECRSLRAFEDVVAVRPPRGPSLLITVSTSPVGRIAWEYDRATLCPVRMISADLETSRQEQTISVVAELDDGEAIPDLLRLLAHPSHHIRWAAVSSIARIDSEAGIDALHRLEGDPHPHVRESARRALEKLGHQGRHGTHH
jgi:hypothetical protein